jgi:hypothetical protein
MTELPEFSGLPDDAAYWDELEARIMANLGPRVRAGDVRREEWWAPIAAKAWGLGGLAAAAGLAAVLLVPSRTHAPEHAAAQGLLRLSIHDARLAPFVTSASPPSIATLVLPPPGRNRE